jgi:MFS family permease
MITFKSWQSIAPALESRNFRLFWLGQIVSTIGTSLQVVAEGWLIYQITQSTFWLGMVGLIGLLPVVPIALLGGIMIDKVPRRKLIMVTQAGLLLQAAVFGLLALSGEIQLWHIILLYFIFGSLLAIDHPARRAFLVELVDETALANAVALNASVFNTSTLIGFTFSGLLIAAIGAGGTMLLNAATYLVPITALALIRVADVGQDKQKRPLATALVAGFRALGQQPGILAAISLMAVVGGLTAPLFGLMPALAEDVLHTGAVGLGALMATGALGSLVGTAVVAQLGQQQRGRTMLIAGLLLPAFIVGVATASNMITAGLFLLAAGLVLLLLQSLAITVVQLHIADQVRGRVMSLYSMVHAGSDTMGTAFIGGIAVHLGLPLALALGGMIALVYTLLLWVIFPAMRHLD